MFSGNAIFRIKTHLPFYHIHYSIISFLLTSDLNKEYYFTLSGPFFVLQCFMRFIGKRNKTLGLHLKYHNAASAVSEKKKREGEKRTSLFLVNSSFNGSRMSARGCRNQHVKPYLPPPTRTSRVCALDDSFLLELQRTNASGMKLQKIHSFTEELPSKQLQNFPKGTFCNGQLDFN